MTIPSAPRTAAEAHTAKTRQRRLLAAIRETVQSSGGDARNAAYVNFGLPVVIRDSWTKIDTRLLAPGDPGPFGTLISCGYDDRGHKSSAADAIRGAV